MVQSSGIQNTRQSCYIFILCCTLENNGFLLLAGMFLQTFHLHPSYHIQVYQFFKINGGDGDREQFGESIKIVLYCSQHFCIPQSISIPYLRPFWHFIVKKHLHQKMVYFTIAKFFAIVLQYNSKLRIVLQHYAKKYIYILFHPLAEKK